MAEEGSLFQRFISSSISSPAPGSRTPPPNAPSAAVAAAAAPISNTQTTPAAGTVDREKMEKMATEHPLIYWFVSNIIHVHCLDARLGCAFGPFSKKHSDRDDDDDKHPNVNGSEGQSSRSSPHPHLNDERSSS